MSQLVRFSVSIDGALLARFDAAMAEGAPPNRSKAISGLMKNVLVESSWKGGSSVAGVITLVYDHHKREFLNKMTHIQHDHQAVIVSTQHVHMSHDDCLEVIIAKGKPASILSLFKALKSVRGIKYSNLSAATTGEGLR